jgi:non-heme chloroperoxidase
VFSHGWPLSADDWDNQMMFFLGKGYRVIAHDRRGHGRSTQVADGHDMDHYADDLAALTAHLGLKDAIHVGHSTGGGEVVHYLARRGQQDVYKAAIISAVPPLMLNTDANPEGLPKSVFDDLQAQLAANRSKFYRDLPEGPFYGFNRPGVKSVEATIANWWRQGMMGGAKAHYDGIVAFSQTDFTEDLKKITIPVLVMHSQDDQIVPYVAAGPKSAKLLKNGTLITYKDFPHGMPTTQADKAARSGITRQGSPWMRWIMVEAAQVATRCSPAAKRYFERLSRKKHKHVARVALARKLLIAVYALLHDGVAFDEEKFAAV